MRAAFSPVVGIIELAVAHSGPPAEPHSADDRNLDETLARLVQQCSAASATHPPLRPAVRHWRLARRSMSQSLSTPVVTIVAHRARLEDELAHETQVLLARLGGEPEA